MEPKKALTSYTEAASKLQTEKEKWQNNQKSSEWDWIKMFKDKNDFSLGFALCEKNAWIIRTLASRKERYKFKTCTNIILVGSGFYPYSLFDVYKQYEHIKLIGVDYDKNCVRISRLLVDTANINDRIKIIHADGFEFDYSFLKHEDLVFLSVDVEKRNEIYNRVIQTSKASVYVCEPKNNWVKNRT
tara:strand:- start:22 stop:582 length:561 start_codon:yes stop_codon:yes gene_type:complete